MSAKVSVIIVHWNQPQACSRTVDAFAQLTEVAEVMVVDNGSGPEERQLLDELLGANVPVIDVGYNSGFGPAANRGWERWLIDGSGTEWSVVAPHDALPKPGTIAAMLNAAHERPAAGLLSADVGDGSIPKVDHVFGPILVPAADEFGFQVADYPHGTLMMASRTCLNSIGLFDERFFAYCEEADLGLRAKSSGFEVGLVRGAMVVNPMVASATPVVEYLMERNTILLMAKHFGRRKAAMRFAMMFWQLAKGSLSAERRTPYWSAPARRRAICDVLSRRWGPPPESLSDSVLVERG